MVRVVTFIEALERHRVELGMGHNDFARYLGMNRTTWSLVRRGERQAGPAFVGRVLVNRPEFARFLDGVADGSTVAA